MYRDLHTYVCTFENCPVGPFTTSHEFFKHELDCHRRQWKCYICNSRCNSASLFDQHLIADHLGITTFAQRQVMQKACQEPLADFGGIDCVFCEKWPQQRDTVDSEGFRVHLTKHLQKLALLALPLAVNDSNESQDMDIEDPAMRKDTKGGFSIGAQDGSYELMLLGIHIAKEKRWICLWQDQNKATVCRYTPLHHKDLLGHFARYHRMSIDSNEVIESLDCPRCDNSASKPDNCTLRHNESNRPDRWIYTYASKSTNMPRQSCEDLSAALRRKTIESAEKDRYVDHTTVLAGKNSGSIGPSSSSYLYQCSTGHIGESYSVPTPSIRDVDDLSWTGRHETTVSVVGEAAPMVANPITAAAQAMPVDSVAFSGRPAVANSSNPGAFLEQYPASTAYPSSTSPIFSNFGHWPSYEMTDTYPVSTAPSGFTALSTLQSRLNTSYTSLSSPRRLGCEFKTWTGCQRSFVLEEDGMNQWIQHIEDDHLCHNYPSRCLCWFCDDVEFRSEQSIDPRMNFEARMHHIVDHVLEGYHFENRRPDFHFLDHVYSIGLISSEAFALAKGQSENVVAPAGMHPSGFRPAARQSRPEAVVYVSNSSRRRQRDTRHHT